MLCRADSCWLHCSAAMKTPIAVLLLLAGTTFSQTMLPCFTPYEVSFQSAGTSTNPYVQITATAEIRHPGNGAPWRIPLFWDGANTWKLRFAPDCPGNWQWRVDSLDPGLDEQSGILKVIPGTNSGGIRPMASHPRHFERQDGTPSGSSVIPLGHSSQTVNRKSTTGPLRRATCRSARPKGSTSCTPCS